MKATRPPLDTAGFPSSVVPEVNRSGLAVMRNVFDEIGMLQTLTVSPIAAANTSRSSEVQRNAFAQLFEDLVLRDRRPYH